MVLCVVAYVSRVFHIKVDNWEKNSMGTMNTLDQLKNCIPFLHTSQIDVLGTDTESSSSF